MSTISLHKTTIQVRPSLKNLFNSPLVLILSFSLGATALFIIGILEKSLLATWSVACFLLVLGLLILLLEWHRSRYPVELARQFWVTFGLRIFVTAITHLWLSGVYFEPFWQWGAGGGDELGFYETSEHWALAWIDGNILTEAPLWWEDDYLAWTYPVGFIRFMGMTLGGDTIFNIKLLSCFFSALLVPYIYKLTQLFFDRDTAKVAAALAFWLPDYWYYGATLLRDVMISCMVVIVIYQIVAGTRDNFKLWRLGLAVGLNFIVIRHLKVWLSELIAVLACAWLYWGFAGQKAVRIFLLICLIILIATPIIVVPSIRYKVFEFVMYVGEPIGLAERLISQSNAGVKVASPDSIGAKIVKMPLLIHVPVFMVQAILNIPPWSSITTYGIVPRAIVETMAAFVWLGFVIFLPTGFLDCIRHDNSSRTVWIWGTALLLLFSIALANTIIPRWRLIVMPFLLILVSRGILTSAYRGLAPRCAVVVTGLLIVYSCIKYL